MPRFALFLLASCLALSSAACGQANPQASPTAGADPTRAMQTIQSQLTQAAQLTPSSPATAIPTALRTEPVATPRPSPTATTGNLTQVPSQVVSEKCNLAAPGTPIDVTIEDDTVMQPGQQFTKVWRLVNAGSCTWTRDYRAEWFYGEKLGDSLSVAINTVVAPSESVEIYVDMTAPEAPGSYQSNWKLVEPGGETFGIGPTGDAPFWVRIVVAEPPTPTPTPTALPSATPTATAPPSPTPTLTPTPQILITGTLSLALQDMLDLDGGTLNPASGADLAYDQQEGQANHWLEPASPARLGVYGAAEPPQQVCMAATMSQAPVAVESLSPGAYLCYRTGQGHFGWLRLRSVDPQTFQIEIAFHTWAGR